MADRCFACSSGLGTDHAFWCDKAQSKPAVSPRPLKLRRSIDRWSKSDPAAMAAQSEAAIYFAFQDAIADIQALANELRKHGYDPR